MRSKMLAMLGAASLLVASGAAAQAAAPLSLANSPAVRAGAELSDANRIRGTARWILGAIVLGLVVWGAIELLDNEDEAFPASP